MTIHAMDGVPAATLAPEKLSTEQLSTAPPHQDCVAQSPTDVQNASQRPDIARDLLNRQALAATVRSVPVGERTDDQLAELRQTDRSNAEMLRRVLSDHGWPGATLVGADAAQAAWLIVLRSDDAKFQAAVLPILADAVVAGEAEPAWWAHLYDRYCAVTGVKQWFGTQFRNGSDGVEVYPVDDPEKLDARRAEYGLGPHAEKAAELRQRHGRAA